MNNARLTDKSQIDEIVKSFFSVFTNTNNRQPNFNLLTKICIPEIAIINVSEMDHLVYTLDSFVEPRKKILTDGTLTEFEEREIAEQTQILGNIAQRHSTYVKSGVKESKAFKQKGQKLFQIIKTGEGWRITSVIWQDDVTSTLP